MPQVAEQLAGNAFTAFESHGFTSYSPLVGSLGGSLRTLDATEADAEQAIHSTITIRNLYIRITFNDLTSGTSIFRTRVNGANGNLSVSISAGATGEFEDLVNDDSLVDGDDANYQDVIQTTMAAEQIVFSIFGVTFEHASIMTSYDVNDRRNNMTRGEPPDYMSIIGGISGAPTETTLQRRVRFVSTISDFNVRVDANATSNGATCTYRVNAAAGNQSVSIGGGATGNFEDGVNTDVLASGDLVDYEMAPAGGGMPDDISFEKIQTKMIDPTTGGYLLDASSFSNTNFGETNFVCIEGAGGDSGSTEADAQLLLRSMSDAEDLYVRITANSLDVAATVRVRLDGADGNLSVSIGAAATGEFEDTTNIDDLDVGVDVNYEIDASSSTVGSITPRIFGIKVNQLENIHTRFLRTSMYSAFARWERRLIPGVVTEGFRSFRTQIPGPPAVPSININTVFASTTMYSTYARGRRRLLPDIEREGFRNIVTMNEILTHVSPNVKTSLVFIATTMYSTYARGVRRLLPDIEREGFRNIVTMNEILKHVSPNVRTDLVLLATSMFSAFKRSSRRLMPPLPAEPFRTVRFFPPPPAPAPTVNINLIFPKTTMYSSFAREVRRLIPDILREPFVTLRIQPPGPAPVPTININTIFLKTSLFSTYSRGSSRQFPEIPGIYKTIELDYAWIIHGTVILKKGAIGEAISQGMI